MNLSTIRVLALGLIFLLLGAFGALGVSCVRHLYDDHLLIDRAREEGEKLKLQQLQRYDELQRQQPQQPQAPKPPGS